MDLFHDTEEAVAVTWDADRRLLEIEGLLVRPVRERPAFVEAEVREGEDAVLLQWIRDSAFRFFPLVEHPDMGLVFHPFDLATNKVLALVGRLEVRNRGPEALPDLLARDALLFHEGRIRGALPQVKSKS